MKLVSRVLWILGEDGRTPVPTDDFLAFGECLADSAKRQVAIDYSDDMDVCVSTVFLGINANHFVDSPRLFESVTFRTGGAASRVIWRTWEEAEAGHAEVCKKLGIEVKGFK